MWPRNEIVEDSGQNIILAICPGQRVNPLNLYFSPSQIQGQCFSPFFFFFFIITCKPPSQGAFLLFFFNNFTYLFLAVLGLCCCMGFSLVVKSARGRLLSSCGVPASHCIGFSRGAQALGVVAFNSCSVLGSVVHSTWG